MSDIPDRLQWTSWPMREEGARAILKILFAAGIIALFFLVFGDLGWLSAPLLLMALARWFLPTTYTLTSTEIASRFCASTRTVPWSRFRRFYSHSIGVHLSPFEVPSPLDPFRGMFVRFGGNREEVLAWIERAGLKRGAKKSAGSPQPLPADPKPPGT